MSTIYSFLIIFILGITCEGSEVSQEQLKRYVYENAPKKWFSFVEKFVFLSVRKITSKADVINFHTKVCILSTCISSIVFIFYPSILSIRASDNYSR